MKLKNRFLFFITISISIILSVWAVLFYYSILEEVYDEVDDQLDNYAQLIMTSFLSGSMSEFYSGDGSNNTFELYEISQETAKKKPKLRYYESMIYIKSKHENEPARVLDTYFVNAENRYFALKIYTPILETHDLRIAILYWMIILYTFLLIILIIVISVVYHVSMRPLYKFLDWMRNFDILHPVPLDNNTSVKEFKELCVTANETLQRIDKLYQSQKMFIANASHEMQTPLAIAINNVDAIVQTDLSEEQLKYISNINKTLMRASAVNKSLLLLAKIDGNVFIEHQKIDISEIINAILPNLQEVYSSKNVSYFVNLNTCILDINPDLASVLVMNLIKNAIIYTPNNGEIIISCGENNFSVSNSSVDNIPLDEKNIFIPFCKSMNNVNSSGIGLTLVKAICDSSNLIIKYFFENNFHTFKISD